jgi:hypothetical protein
VAGSKHAWEAVGKLGGPPGRKEWGEGDEHPTRETELRRLVTIAKSLEEVTEEFIGRLEELERYIIKDALIIWEAFSACCKEKCGLEPEKHVKMWFEPMLPL